MIIFDCTGIFYNCNSTWRGYISGLVYTGGLLEISIMMDRIVTANVCKTTFGYFVYFPNYECGVNLESLFNVGESFDRLAFMFNDKDASTVAYAINKVGNLLSQTSNNTVVMDENELPF